MSAFVVEDKTINAIVGFLSREGNAYPTYGVCKRVMKKAGYNVEITEQAERLAIDLFEMNCEAVDQRYKPGTAETFRNLNFKYRPILADNKIQVFKAMECLLYQCSEGDVYKSPLYEALEEVKNRLACSLVATMPQYEKAVWN